MPRGDHQESNADQHRRQSDAESHDQKQTETDPLHRHRAQEHDQRRGTRNDAAANAERQKLSQRSLSIQCVIMCMLVMVGVPMMIVTSMLM